MSAMRHGKTGKMADAVKRGAAGPSDAKDAAVHSDVTAASPDAAAADAPDATVGSAPSVSGKRTLFLRSCLWDLVMTLPLSVALVLTVSFAFESVPDLRGNLGAVCAIVLPLLIIGYAGSRSKRAAAGAAAAAAVFSLVVIGGFALAAPPDAPLFSDGVLNDAPENGTLFALVACLVPLAVFLLSRRTVGAVILFALTVVLCGAVQFLYRDWTADHGGTVVALAAYVAAGALCIFQRYRRSAYQASFAGTPAFGAAAGFSVLLATLCVSVAFAVFSLVIAPLNVQTLTIKPFQEYYTRPVVEYAGVYDEQSVDDPDRTTQRLNDERTETGDNADGGATALAPSAGDGGAANPLAAFMESVQSFDADDWDSRFAPITYRTVALGSLILAFAVFAAVAAALLLRRRRWGRRMAAWNAQERPEAVRQLYDFIGERLNKLGFARNPSLTPMEYAVASQAELAPFARGTEGASYLSLTLIYQRACFDSGRTTEEDWQTLQRFYARFPENARHAVSRRRWLRVFWRL